VVTAIVKKAQIAADTLLTDKAIDPDLGSSLPRSKGAVHRTRYPP
jgi:hypothetical protein